MTNDAAVLTPTLGARLRRQRRTAIIIGLVLAAALLLAWSQRGANRGFLDPEAYNDAGSRAVAALLADRGVEVVRVTSTSAAVDAVTDGPSSTLLIVVPDLLQEGQVTRLADAAPDAIVLIAPTSPVALDPLAPGIAAVDAAETKTREPECGWPAATRAGAAQTGGVSYTRSGPPVNALDECYLDGGRPTIVHRPSEPGTSAPWAYTIVGDPTPFQNDSLATEGNAALALNLLSENDRVVWYLPSVEELGEGDQSVMDLAPDWVFFVAIQFAVVIGALVLWRGRRFGPVLPERLPAVVPATETIEGRGRLYRKSRSRGRAAAALRQGTIDRLARPCGFTNASPPDEIVHSIGESSGVADAEVAALLFGPLPDTDARLIALADQLQQLERTIL